MNNLLKIRIKHNLTQQGLADLLSVSKSNVCYMESHKMTFSTAERIGKVLRENPFDIIGEDIFKEIPAGVADINSIRRTLDKLEEEALW